MEIGSFIWNLRNSLLFVFVFLFFGCSLDRKSDNEEGQFLCENIENAFLVCRLGNGYFSKYFKKYASKEQKYSHIGIVSKEEGKLYVYHSEASELTGVGFVKKEPLQVFLKHVEVFDFYALDFSDSIKTKIIENAQAYYKKQTPFDLRFDSFDDKALYCSELIATSINTAKDTVVIEPNLVLNGKKLYALDDIYLHESVKRVEVHCTK